ncbi:MAG TPA: serine hydrolase domain-containing protein [Thermoanaerobaculia bacterium]|jgi:CubicO group peptidase (beta-lactamase class C family)|nr:serine hydrolase domain-containing protein [Thermoanaerobaculia bacterium]
MRTRTALFSLLLVAVAFSCGEHASAAEPKDLARSVDAVFAEYAKPGSPGCSLAVVQNGRIVYEKGYGLASIEHGVPIDPKRTVFDIGSTSKQITAASILLLAQDGKLSLDDAVRKHVPELPDYGTPVTIRHLLHHTSGIRDYINLMAMGGINFEDWATDGDALAAIARQKTLDFKPGSEHSYSNSGYFLLSQIVERVSGKKMREFAQERIFGPLGMTNTQILDDHTKVIPHRASSYGPGPEGGFAIVMSNWEQTGDGAVQTTVEDLAKWDQNFYDPKVGGAWLVEQLQTKGKLNDGETIDYARGLMVADYRGLRRVSHGGGWAGYRAEMIRFPDQKLSVVTLCNLGTANPSALAQQVADLYLADKLQPEAQPAAAANEAPAGKLENAARYTGVYWSPAGGLVRRIEVRDGKLFYVRGNGNDSELAPLGGDRFQMVGAPAEVSFAVSATAAGGPRRMELVAGGGKPTVFEEVKPVSPTPEGLAAYAGTYTSPELDTTWMLAVEGGRLVLRGKRGPAMPLEPAFADAFESPAGLIRFQREGQKVTRLLVGAGRARDLKFTRTAG